MAISTTENELLRYMSIMNETQKNALLGFIQSLILPDQIQKSTLSKAEYSRELNEALQKVKEGNYTTLEQLEKEMINW